MLQIKSITKRYKTGDFVQDALFEVSLNFRKNEFAAVLGPSGSGKTTLLNIVGGLDHYDSGDLIINGVSTRKYKDRDWDAYRNHAIGFVFQSYNLIPHQSVLANVELALTISGVSSQESKRRAQEALAQVDLLEHQYKRPNELSGGQMQRVAIARALVNNPDILLADEPTGALDSETGKQVMELLKKVAQDRLVIMVTHDSELADAYAGRIIRLMDGKVISDSNPHPNPNFNYETSENKIGKASMSFKTALKLSFNNLRTKFGRTLLTAFAGSIGIIGIALILSLSGGVSRYIDNVQKETMISYPITLEAQALDLAALMSDRQEHMQENIKTKPIPEDLPQAALVNMGDIRGTSGSRISTTENNLTSFKQYLDDLTSPIHQYIGENGVVYSYDLRFTSFTIDPKGEQVKYEVKPSTNTTSTLVRSTMAIGNNQSGPAEGNRQNPFQEILKGGDQELISPIILENYILLEGRWPTAYDELLIVLNEENKISATQLYRLGFLPQEEYRELQKKIDNKEDFEFPEYELSFAELLNKEIKLLTPAAFYQEQDNGTFSYIGDDDFLTESLLKDALTVKTVGVIRPKAEAKYQPLLSPLVYTSALSTYLINTNNEMPVLIEQERNPERNILNGLSFEPPDQEAKLADSVAYVQNLNISEKAALFTTLLRYGAIPMNDTSNVPYTGSGMNETVMAGALDNYLKDPDEEVLLRIYDSALAGGSYKDNLSDFGKISPDAPSSINIYTDSFEDKDLIAEEIARYNEQAEEQDRITYTDYVALLMSSVTSIIDVISYVLIAFVAVSLIVSCIMIGIITYISVLERTKEIGILRAIGASKSNISQVFNAETFIVGLFSGLLGITITYLILLPGNALIHKLIGSSDMKAFLNPVHALGLIGISIFLTLIGGMIPARLAAQKDPVAALRTE